MKKFLIPILIIFLASCERPHVERIVTPQGATLSTDGSQPSVAAAISQANPGDIVSIPGGNFTWTSGVKITKAIKLQGAGSGRIIGNTLSSIAIGTGSKTFATTKAISGLSVGQVLRVAKMPERSSSYPRAGRENFIEGTVSNISGQNITLDVTKTGGSGTWKFWWIATKTQTQIINKFNNGCNSNNGCAPVIDLSESGAEVSGIQITNMPGSYSSCIGFGGSQWLQPQMKIHDMWFQLGDTDSAGIYAGSNHAVIWNCSFDNNHWSSNIEGIQLVFFNNAGKTSWSTNSTMGMADTNGATNLYVEDCDFHALLSTVDWDSNGRAVFRHNIIDNSCLGTHGADTSTIGVRHWEFYDNELIFNAFGSDCSPELDLQWFFWGRGGTGVITDNIIPNITSQCIGTGRYSIKFSVLNIQRNSGSYCCWKNYPAPQQIGQGYQDGCQIVQYTSTCGGYSGQRYDYPVFNEPVYIWNNTGTAGNRVGLMNDADQCGNGKQVSDFIQEGRDYKIAAKSGYQKYTYPHPLRGGGGGSPTPAPSQSPQPTATQTAQSTATIQPTSTPSATAAPSSTPPGVPIAPSSLSANATASRIEIAWLNNDTNVQSIYLERSTDGGNNFQGFNSFPSTAQWTFDDQVTAGNSYFYRVRAKNAAGYSPYSNVASATFGGGTSPSPSPTATATATATVAPPSPTPAPTPAPTSPPPTQIAAPSGLTARLVQGKRVQLTWQDNSDNENGFEIARSTRTNGTCINWPTATTLPANSTNWKDSSTSKNQTYCYRVRALGLGGAHSEWSESAEISP